jgi:hypothetical protein
MRQPSLALAILVVGVSVACSPSPPVTPPPQSLPTVPTRSPLSLAVSTSQAIGLALPEGLKLETERTVGISIGRPEDWQRDTGTKNLPSSGAPVNYVVYYRSGPGTIQMMSIQTLAIYYPFQSERDIIKEVLGANEAIISETNLRVIDFSNDVTVAGQPAQLMSYRIDDQRSGLPLFSIIVVVATPEESAIILQWASNESMREETTNLFLRMLGTVQLVR